MPKIADFLISKVKYRQKPRHIESVWIHEDDGEKDLLQGKEMSREWVVALIERGVDVCTIVKNSEGGYRKGEPVEVITVNGKKFIKTVPDHEERDNLENLPEF